MECPQSVNKDLDKETGPSQGKSVSSTNNLEELALNLIDSVMRQNVLPGILPREYRAEQDCGRVQPAPVQIFAKALNRLAPRLFQG
jgi:hypothetical protein